LLIILIAFAWSGGCRSHRASDTQGSGVLDALAKPQKGRLMRATSTMRVGELRRGPKWGKGHWGAQV